MTDKKAHPWRQCVSGKHWVRRHKRRSQKASQVYTVKGHCRLNTSGKDQLYTDELMEMVKKYFGELETLPSFSKNKYSNADKYDKFIVGWVKYWNDVLRPSVPLDPRLVKALIATESRFMPEAKALASPRNFARGLMHA